MRREPRQNLEAELERLEEDIEKSRISTEDGKAIRQLCYAYDEDHFEVAPPSDEKQKKREPTTIMNWCVVLRKTAKKIELTSATANEVNKYFSDRLNDELKRNTVRNYQSSARRFYRYHSELNIDPEKIILLSTDGTSIDPTDMLTREEIQCIRNSTEHPRNLAVIDLLLYTGQRNMAIRSLRIQDVDVDKGVFYLNPNVDGLKGARNNGRERPLLLAEASVRDWLRYHPCPEDGDAYLVTAKGKFHKPNPQSMVSQQTINRICRVAKEETDITKPLHPHALRHNFVTMAKRSYDMDDATIKYLIGHSSSSRVMETTYAHLSGQDHIDHAEVQMGIKEQEDESPLTPPSCPRCGEVLSSTAKACSSCGMLITPDAQASIDVVNETSLKGIRRSEDKEEAEAVEKVRDFLTNNPDVAIDIVEELESN